MTKTDLITNFYPTKPVERGTEGHHFEVSSAPDLAPREKRIYDDEGDV